MPAAPNTPIEHHQPDRSSSPAAVHTNGMHRQHDHRAEQVGVEQRGLAGIGARQRCGSMMCRPRSRSRCRARAAPPAACRRSPAASPAARRKADQIAVQRRQPTHSPSIGPAQDRDQERRREQDRQRLVELQIAQRDEIEARSSPAAAPSGRPAATAAPVRSSPGWLIGLENDQRQQERAGVTRPRRPAASPCGVEIFRRRVEAGEAAPPRRTSARCRSAAGGAARGSDRSIRRPSAGNVEHRAGRERAFGRRAKRDQRRDLLDRRRNGRAEFSTA